MASIDLACFAVSGKSSSMIVQVSMMMLTPKFGMSE
jgi:hypothetical protein